MRAIYKNTSYKRIFFLSIIIFISINGCMLEGNDARKRNGAMVKIKEDSSIVTAAVVSAPDTSILKTETEEDEEFDIDQIVGYIYKDYSEKQKINIDLDQIKKRKKLIALTGYSYTSYFIYKGTPMGYEYDLLKMLADDLGVELEIVIVNDMDEIFDMLNRGEGDIIADNLTITKEREELVNFTIPHNLTRQMLVQKKPKNWKYFGPEQLEAQLVRNPVDLIGKNVHVRKESSYYARLHHLSDEVGGDINIVEAPGDIETEELIGQVAEGKIPFTVADENIAMMNKPYYPDLDFGTPISFSQRIAWAVRSDSPKLLKAVNDWISRMKKDPTYYVIYDKYHKPHRLVDHMVSCGIAGTCARNLSPYDKMIIQHAKEIGWDWRLLASLIYQESQFDPQAKSWVGAAGLMQLMPMTAESFGASNVYDPVQSIKAGTSYLKWLDEYWKVKVPDREERIKFIMASYNVGQEHVADAQRLAIKYHRNPQKWDDNVAYFILQKSKPQYCSDPVVRYGYCRGSEPFNYVNQILGRYEHYKKLIHNEG
ncbi:MAG: transporter substrate-binding domain-containing protein [Cytophagaceae bacterium]